MATTTRIGIIGDYNPGNPTHVATNEGIQHAAQTLGDRSFESSWLSTDQRQQFGEYQGLLCSPGSHYRSLEGALLGIQYARQMGFRTFAVGRGKDKEELARKLGDAHYVDTAAGDPAAELQKFGGARVILATAPDSKSMAALFDGLSVNGEMVVVGATQDPIPVTPIQLIRGRKALQGWASGIATDSEDTMRFSTLTGVRPMIEKFPLEKAAEAYDQMISGRARFRVVLTMGG